MKIEIVEITPEYAAKLLAKNPENRPIKRVHLESMTRDMIAGHWQLNGDAIRLSSDGSLIDGQHRLSACVGSGVPFKTILISGLPHDVRATIDGGSKRTFGDRLSMRGVHNSNVVAAAIKLMAGMAMNGQDLRAVSLTTSEMDAILLRHPGVQDSASTGNKVFPSIGALVTAVHYIGHYVGRGDEADLFRGVWKTGVPLYPGDAAHFVREVFIRNQSGTLNKIPVYAKQKLFVYSWIKFCAQSPMKVAKTPEIVAIPGWTREALGL